MGYSYLKPSILFKKKKKNLVLLEVYFIIGHFLKHILSPFGIGKAVPRFCGK